MKRAYRASCHCGKVVAEETLSKVPVVAIDGLHDRMHPPEFAVHL